MCYIGSCLSGPIEKKIQIWRKKNWLKKCARLPPNFDNHTFQKIINKKISNWIWTLKFWYKHPYYLPIGSEKSQNDRIYIKTAIWEFAGVKEKVRKLFSGLFFCVFRQTCTEYVVFAGPKVIYHLKVYPWGFLGPFSEFRYVP